MDTFKFSASIPYNNVGMQNVLTNDKTTSSFIYLFIWIFITPFNYTIAKIIHIKYKTTVQKAQEGLALTTGLEFIYTILFENETKNNCP